MTTREVSSRQEKQIAQWVNGRVQTNSGGTRFGGGDVHTKRFLIEAKTPTTDKKSFCIKKEWINKAKQQAFEQDKLNYALAFRFEPDGEDYYVIDKLLFKQIVKLLEEN